MRAYFGVVLILAFASISACSRYSFDINNNEIYRPPTLFTNFSLADPALQSCVDQAIKDGQITSASDLKALQCSYAGVTTIKGLSLFSRIQQLSLKGNQLENVDELLQLTHLSFLDLSETQVSDCQTLGQLETLVTDRFLHDQECDLQ